MKKDYIFERFPHMLHGGDYNPDQWQDYPSVLEEDMRLFRLANCNEVSLGIFAWAALEKQEGVFDFRFMDRAMDAVAKAGGKVILATPSGARPAWLSQKYPEVLRYNENFVPNLHGRRHNHCYTSPVYREKVGIINRKLAERYKDHPALLGWHVSNEYNGRCYCPNCQAAFREFLKEKYGTLEALNAAWWTSFWSHNYTDWSQIDPPSPRGEMDIHGLNVDWRRFCSRQTTLFLREEIRPLHEVTPHAPVTTNLMDFHENIDYYELSKELDFASFDIYPPWRGKTEYDLPLFRETALYYDLTRSLLHRPFLLMEITPSATNWQPINKLKRPGVHMAASMQAIAHGSESVLYFQFRKGRGCSEKFHGAIVDHEGSENTRVFREVSQVGARLKGLSPIVGSQNRAKVALLFDWGSRWMLEDARGFQLKDKKLIPTIQRFYDALWNRGIDTDVIEYGDDFSRYDVLIAPMCYSMSEAVGRKLKDFVANGGRLLATYVTAMVNETDLCYLGGLPGAGLRELFGIWNEEIDTLYPDEKNTVRFSDGTVVDAVDYCERIHPEGAQVLASYETDFYAGEPAVTCNAYGKGKAYYLAFRDTGDGTEKMVGAILDDAGVTSSFDGYLPLGVTAHCRTNGEEDFLFLQNCSYEEKSVETAKVWVDFETKERLSGTLLLPPLTAKILLPTT